MAGLLRQLGFYVEEPGVTQERPQQRQQQQRQQQPAAAPRRQAEAATTTNNTQQRQGDTTRQTTQATTPANRTPTPPGFRYVPYRDESPNRGHDTGRQTATPTPAQQQQRQQQTTTTPQRAAPAAAIGNSRAQQRQEATTRRQTQTTTQTHRTPTPPGLRFDPGRAALPGRGSDTGRRPTTPPTPPHPRSQAAPRAATPAARTNTQPERPTPTPPTTPPTATTTATYAQMARSRPATPAATPPRQRTPSSEEGPQQPPTPSTTKAAQPRRPTRTVPPALLSEKERAADPGFKEVRPNSANHAEINRSIEAAWAEIREWDRKTKIEEFVAASVSAHTSFGAEQARLHLALLADTYVKANPLNRPFWYCQGKTAEGGPCTYATEVQEKMANHIATRHVGQRVSMKRLELSTFRGGAANNGVSCALTVAAAMWQTRPDARRDTEAQRAFENGTAEATESLISVLGVELPTTPAEALEAIVRHEVATESSDSDPTQSLVTITGEVNIAMGAPSTQRQLTRLALEIEDGARTGTATEVLFDIVPPRWAGSTLGVREIPLDIAIRRDAESEPTAFVLHAVAHAVTRTHLVASVRELRGDSPAEADVWHRYDGAKYERDVQPPSPDGVVLLLYRRANPLPPTPPAPPSSVIDGDAEEQQEEEESGGDDDDDDDSYTFVSDDGSEEGGAPEAKKPTTAKQRRAQARMIYAGHIRPMSLLGGSPPESLSDEEAHARQSSDEDVSPPAWESGNEDSLFHTPAATPREQGIPARMPEATSSKRRRPAPSERTTGSSTDGGETSAPTRSRNELADTLRSMLAKIAGQSGSAAWRISPAAAFESVVHKKQTWTGIFERSTRITVTCGGCGYVPTAGETRVNTMLLNAAGADTDRTAEAILREALRNADPPDTTTQCPSCRARRQRSIQHATPQAVAFILGGRGGFNVNAALVNIPRAIAAPHAASDTVSLGLAAVIRTDGAGGPEVFHTKWDARGGVLSWIRIGEHQRHVPVTTGEVTGDILVYIPAAAAHQDATAATAATATTKDSWEEDSLWRELAPQNGQHGFATRLFAPVGGARRDDDTTEERSPPPDGRDESELFQPEGTAETRAATPSKREEMQAFLRHLCAGGGAMIGPDAVDIALQSAIGEHEAWEELFACAVETERRCGACGRQRDGDTLEDTAVIGIRVPPGASQQEARRIVETALGTHTAYNQSQCEECGVAGEIVNRRLLSDAAAVVTKTADNTTTATTANTMPWTVRAAGRGGTMQRMCLVAAVRFDIDDGPRAPTATTRVYLAPSEKTGLWGVAGGGDSQDARRHAADIAAQVFLYASAAAAPTTHTTPATDEETEETEGDDEEEERRQQQQEQQQPAAATTPQTTADTRPAREEIDVDEDTAASDADDETFDVDAPTGWASEPPQRVTEERAEEDEVLAPATPTPATRNNNNNDNNNNNNSDTNNNNDGDRHEEENPDLAFDPFLAETPPTEDATPEEEETTAANAAPNAQQQFAHGENIATAQSNETIRCPFCVRERKWEPNPNGQHKERNLFVKHLNGQHRGSQPENDLLKQFKIDRCLACRMFVVASERARAAHRCQRQEPEATAAPATEQTTTAETTTAPVRDFRGDTASGEDAAWMATTSASARYLHKNEWKQWRGTVSRVLTGYTASAAPERWRRQMLMTTVVRENLGMQQRKNKENADAQEATAAPQSTQQRARATRREVTEEDWGAPQTETTASSDDNNNNNGHNNTTARPTTAEHQQHQQQQPYEESDGSSEDEADRTAEEEAEEQLRKRILTQLALGAQAKAARSLFNTQMPHATVEQALPLLNDLHPQEDVQQLPLPSETPYTYDVKPERVRAIIVKKLGRAAAPGLDGWTRELLVPIAEDDGLLAELTALVQDILIGNVSTSFAVRIRACVLHPFRKELTSMKVRPITPESIIAKLASHIALDSVDKSFRAVFKGWQYGVWGDSTEAVKEIRAAYADDGADTLVALDATNAYNRMSRRHILEAAYAQPALRLAFGAINLSLGAAGALTLYENGARVCELASTKGVRQGMVLSPLLFANGMASVLAPIMRKHPHVKVIAYLDDITVVGKNAAVQNFLEEAGDELSKIGFDINPAKSHHLSKRSAPDALNISGTTIPLSREVVRILGAGFRGDGLPVEEWVYDKTKEHDHYFKKLDSEWLPRLARLQLLRGCTVPRLNHLLRTHKPEELNRATTWFDEQVMRTAKNIANISGHTGPAQDEEQQQRESSITELLVRLPLSKGGLGLRSQNAIAQFASEAVGVKDGQRAQTAVVDTTNEMVLFSLLAEPDRLFVEANTAAGATRAFVDPAVAMPDFAAEIMLKQRLLQRVLPVGCTCVCGKDANNHHVNTCSRIDQGARIERHNMVRDAVVVWAREIGFEARAEPPNRYETEGGIANSSGISTTIRNSQRKRLDVEIVTPMGSMTTDVTITYPGRSETGALPVQEAFAGKKRKHGATQEALHKNFVPLAMESTGGIHREGFKWLREVAGTRQHPYTTNTALSMVLSQIAQNVHVGNAHIFRVVDRAFLAKQNPRPNGSRCG